MVDLAGVERKEAEKRNGEHGHARSDADDQFWIKRGCKGIPHQFSRAYYCRIKKFHDRGVVEKPVQKR